MDTELKGSGCSVYKKCGGCQLQNLTYPEQLSFMSTGTVLFDNVSVLPAIAGNGLDRSVS